MHKANHWINLSTQSDRINISVLDQVVNTDGIAETGWVWTRDILSLVLFIFVFVN